MSVATTTNTIQLGTSLCHGAIAGTADVCQSSCPRVSADATALGMPLCWDASLDTDPSLVTVTLTVLTAAANSFILVFDLFSCFSGTVNRALNAIEYFSS